MAEPFFYQLRIIIIIKTTLNTIAMTIIMIIILMGLSVVPRLTGRLRLFVSHQVGTRHLANCHPSSSSPPSTSSSWYLSLSSPSSPDIQVFWGAQPYCWQKVGNMTARLTIRMGSKGTLQGTSCDILEALGYYPLNCVILHSLCNFTRSVWFYSQCVILLTVFALFEIYVKFLLCYGDLRCFVARQFLSQIHAPLSGNCSDLKIC